MEERWKIPLVISYAFFHAKTERLIHRNSKHIYRDRMFRTLNERERL